MKDNFVSIIIPCFGDYWKYLPDCLNSLKDQTCKDFEVIIDSFPSVSEARNRGFRRSIGDFILFLDADDKIHPKYIEEILKNDVDILMPGYQEFGEHNAMGKLPNIFNYNFAKDNDVFITSAALKRKFFVEYRDIEREDRDFWSRVLLKNPTVKKIDDILFFYGKHGKSRSSNL